MRSLGITRVHGSALVPRLVQSGVGLALLAGSLATVLAVCSLWSWVRTFGQLLSALPRVEAPGSWVAPPPRPAAELPVAAARPAPLSTPAISAVTTQRDPAPMERSELPKQIGAGEPLRYSGAACNGVFVYVVSIAESAPRRSAVSLATSGKGSAKYAHPGQRVGDWEVLAITDDWTGTNPTVWLARDSEVCRTGLTGNPARRWVPPKPRKHRRRHHRRRRRRRRHR